MFIRRKRSIHCHYNWKQKMHSSSQVKNEPLRNIKWGRKLPPCVVCVMRGGSTEVVLTGFAPLADPKVPRPFALAWTGNEQTSTTITTWPTKYLASGTDSDAWMKLSLSLLWFFSWFILVIMFDFISVSFYCCLYFCLVSRRSFWFRWAISIFSPRLDQELRQTFIIFYSFFNCVIFLLWVDGAFGTDSRAEIDFSATSDWELH